MAPAAEPPVDEALAELFTQLKDLGDDGKHKKVGTRSCQRAGHLCSVPVYPSPSKRHAVAPSGPGHS